MRRCKNTRRIARGLAGLFAFSFIMMNVTQTYAAEDKLAEMNAVFEGETAEDAEGEDPLEELQSFFLSGDEDESYSKIVIANPVGEIIMPLLDAYELQNVTWYVQPGTRYVSSRFSLKKGQHVVMSSLTNPTKVTYWMGIMKDSNGDAAAVEGQSGLAHTFEVWADGKYRVFIQNRGDKKIEAYCSYYYY